MDKNKQIGARLRVAREHAGFKTAAEAAISLGKKYQTYAAHENGSRGVVRAAPVYARRFRVSLDWLLRNLGPGPGDAEPVIAGMMTVPLLTWISAGALSREDIRDEALGSVNVTSLPEGDWIALRVQGDSMDRISPPESIIFVNRNDKQLVANACYVIADEDGAATYKRYRPGPPPRFEPVSTNQEHEPIFPDHTPMIVGRVRRSSIDM